MKKSRIRDPEGDSVLPVSSYYESADNRYKVTIELNLKAESIDEAWELIREFIQEAIADKNERDQEETIYDYDVLDPEPAEIEF